MDGWPACSSEISEPDSFEEKILELSCFPASEVPDSDTGSGALLTRFFPLCLFFCFPSGGTDNEAASASEGLERLVLGSLACTSGVRFFFPAVGWPFELDSGQSSAV